jgi:hypothetical protein
MISAEDALGIADQAARDAEWGGVGEGYHAGKLSREIGLACGNKGNLDWQQHVLNR